METCVTTAVCKSLQSIGLNKRIEHLIENTLVNQLRSSGPEFVLKRLSDLSDWRKMHMRGDTMYHVEWHSFKLSHGVAKPSDPIGANLWKLSDKAFFACIGAIKTSILLDQPTEKQLAKWYESVRCENHSDNNFKVRFACNSEVLKRMEELLNEKWSQREWFSPCDITGSRIPGSGKFMNVKIDSDMRKQSLSLLSAYGFSVSTAPLFTWQFMRDINLPDRLAKSSDHPDELIESLDRIIDEHLESYTLQDEALMGSSFMDDEQQLEARKHKNSQLGFNHTVGDIGLIQKPGGKLRTVANPNRLVQYVNRPLGEVLSECFYNQTGVFVLNQREGHLWAQDKLRNKISLSSFDMSSATDRLDYRKFINDYFRELKSVPDQYPLLARSFELFEDTSSCNWSIPGHIADLCGMNCSEIGWTVGQPLGLRPSFPLLTIMNTTFAKHAVREVDGKFTPGHFACVGDDLVIETRYADAYMEAVAAYNGKINNEKSIVSDRFAEFCSQMVTRSTIYPLKPRFLSEIEGSLMNVEKFSTSGLHPVVPKWLVKIHNQLAQHHLDGFNTIKYSVSANPKPLMERIGLNTLIQVIEPASRDPEKVTLQTLFCRAEQEREQFGKMPAVRELSTSYANDAYRSFGGSVAQPKVMAKYEGSPSRFEYGSLGKVSTDTSTSVEVPVKKEWDFRKAQYIKPSSEVSQAKKILKRIESVETEVADELVESITVVKDVETSIIVDTSPEVPEVMIQHKNVKTGVSTPVRKVTDFERKLEDMYNAIHFNDDDYDLSL